MAARVTPTMSEQAGLARSARRSWAAPGGRHDRLIAWSRIVLPALIGVLAALLAVAPLVAGRDISFVLAKDRVAVAHERMRVSEALYRGEDEKGQPFQLRAASAVQASSSVPVVKMQMLSARIGLDDGVASLVAPTGQYDMDRRVVDVTGPVRLTRADGSVVQTRDVSIDLASRRLASREPVDGTIPLGRFRADRLSGDLEAHTLNLDGGVRLHIVQRRGRAAR